MDQGRAHLEKVIEDQEECIPQKGMKLACTKEGKWWCEWGM